MRVLATTILFSVLTLDMAAAIAESHSVRVGHAEVSYGDLDINSMDGARILYERIGTAARGTCEFFRSMDSLYEEPFTRCYAKTVSDAVAEVKNAMVEQVHATATLADESATPSACFDLLVETLMPHLEDNLRYANTQEMQCVTQYELHRLFPVLAHPALAGCRLGDEKRTGDKWLLELACAIDHGTRGTAIWQVWGDGEIGELAVRLGGKNMTFSQRLTARPTKSTPESH